MINPPVPGDQSAEELAYGEIITAIVKRFVRLAGIPAALNVARKVPRLTVDDDCNVLEFNSQDPLGTISFLIDQYEVLYGDIARTLARQAAEPLAAISDDKLLHEVGGFEASLSRVGILVVTDHLLFGEGLVSLLEAQSQFKVIGRAASIKEARAKVRELPPQLVLMDMNLPDGTGAEATRILLMEAPETKIVVLSLIDEGELLFEAIRSGAIGYLSKNIGITELNNTLLGVMRGEAGISGTTARRILVEFTRLSSAQPDETITLTLREIEVLGEVAKGASNREIAQRLVISENTVKIHVRNVLGKLHFHNRREAGDYARRHGLVARRPPD